MVLIVVSKQIIQEELAREILKRYHIFTNDNSSKQIIPEELAREILRIYLRIFLDLFSGFP